MSRPASDATQLRNARAKIRVLDTALIRAQADLASLRASLKAARQETEEWKGRFDKLLERDTRNGLSG